MPIIEFSRSEGRNETLDLEPDQRELDLRESKIHEINLEGLKDCQNIEVLNLSNNFLETIDLQPLSSCRRLRELNLQDNELIRLQTEPLRPCTELEHLDVSMNSIESINLDILTTCNNILRLDLSLNQIHEIDLSPLSNCRRLQWFSIARNNLTSIDLRPLSACQDLTTIHLFMNWISEIDLTPLASCHSMEELQLHQNPFKSIDVKPLASCKKLKDLGLSWSHSRGIDLTPLIECKELQSLFIDSVKIDEIDLIPLSHFENLEVLHLAYVDIEILEVLPFVGCPNLKKLYLPRKAQLNLLCGSYKVQWTQGITQHLKQYSIPKIREIFDSGGWSNYLNQLKEIYQKLSPLGRYYVRMSLIEMLELDDLRAVDVDIVHTLSEIMSETYESFRDSLSSKLIHALSLQINEGRSTLFLNLERIKHIPELVVHTPKILAIRKQEIDEVEVTISNNMVNLRNLWFCAYTHELLLAAGVGLDIDVERFEALQLKMKSLGHSVRISEGKPISTPTRFSDELRAYVLFAVKLNKEMQALSS